MFTTSGSHLSYPLYIQQGKQCTYDVALRRIRATIVVVDKQRIVHILSVCL